MEEDRAYVAENTRERERLRALVERLTDDELSLPVNEYWTVAAIFGHIASWDARVLSLPDKLERADPFTSSDTEPEDVEWINDASRRLIHAIQPREVADAIGAPTPRHVPVWLGRLFGGELGVTMMTELRGASNDKAKRKLGWELRYPSWRQGFRDGLDSSTRFGR